MEKLKVGVIGAGQIGSSIILGLLQSNLVKKANIFATTGYYAESARVKEKLKIKVYDSNTEMEEDSDIIMVCTKTYKIRKILLSLGNKIFKKGFRFHTIDFQPS